MTFPSASNRQIIVAFLAQFLYSQIVLSSIKLSAKASNSELPGNKSPLKSVLMP